MVFVHGHTRHLPSSHLQAKRLEELEKLYREEQVSRKRAFNMMEDLKGKIRVYCRVRPILQFEVDKGQVRTGCVSLGWPVLAQTEMCSAPVHGAFGGSSCDLLCGGDMWFSTCLMPPVMMDGGSDFVAWPGPGLGKHMPTQRPSITPSSQAEQPCYNTVHAWKICLRKSDKCHNLLAAASRHAQAFGLNIPDELTVTHLWKDEKKPREYSFDQVRGRVLLGTQLGCGPCWRVLHKCTAQ